MTNSGDVAIGFAAILVVLIVLVIGIVKYKSERPQREQERAEAVRRLSDRTVAPSPAPSTAPELAIYTSGLSETGGLLGTIIIIVGLIAAASGLGSWLLADPRDSAFRQTVTTLWALCGLMGLMITAIGIAIIVIERAILSRINSQR